MSAGATATGPAGVRNLRAMFENKSTDQSTSPPSRGRSSPNGSVSSAHSRPVSKVRSSFVAVERPGEAGQPAQWGLRKTSDVSSMAEVREQAIMEEDPTSVTPEVTDGMYTQDMGLGAILKGSPFEPAHGEMPPSSASLTDKRTAPAINKKLESNPKVNGVTNKVASMIGKMQTTNQSRSEPGPATTKEKKPSKSIPTSINTTAAPAKPKESPSRPKQSPVLQKKSQDSPTSAATQSGFIKPKGGVNKIKGVMESAKKADEERTRVDDQTNAPKSAKSKDDEDTNGGASGLEQQAELDSKQAVKAKEKKPRASLAGYSKIPSVATKATAASKAHSQTDAPAVQAPSVRSPTATRPSKLPSAATAPTAASAARKGTNAGEVDESKTTIKDRRSLNPQAPRVASATTKSSLAKKSSRASLANGNAGSDAHSGSRLSSVHRPANESFLARMTRPTASSAQKATEKAQVNSPPRPRRISEKPSRRSLNVSAKQASIPASDTVVTQTYETSVNDFDDGEPGPAEEDDGSDFPSQQAEVPRHVSGITS